MSNRRFESLGANRIVDTITDKIYDGVDDFEEIMNNLHSENEELKSEIQAQKQIIDKQEMKLAEYNNQINVSTN